MNIIKFPPKKSLEDRFMESLTEEQFEMFGEIMLNVEQEYEKLYQTTQDITKKYIDKVVECEELKNRRNNED